MASEGGEVSLLRDRLEMLLGISLTPLLPTLHPCNTPVPQPWRSPQHSHFMGGREANAAGDAGIWPRLLGESVAGWGTAPIAPESWPSALENSQGAGKVPGCPMEGLSYPCWGPQCPGAGRWLQGGSWRKGVSLPGKVVNPSLNAPPLHLVLASQKSPRCRGAGTGGMHPPVCAALPGAGPRRASS